MGESKVFVADSEDEKDAWLSAIGSGIVRASHAVTEEVMDY
jgi:hypothetical protein